MCSMASRLWLLVKWIDERDCFPTYGVVNVDILAYDESKLQPGNEIIIRIQHENPRRAKILLISESKRYVNEHKKIMESQDHQVKNVFQMCMQSIREMNTENSFAAQQKPSSRSSLPLVVVAQNDNRDSDSHPGSSMNGARSRSFRKSTQIFTAPFNRTESTGTGRDSFKENDSRWRSIVTSTPLPSSSSAHETKRLCFDQATQTEAFSPTQSKLIEDLELAIGELYRMFLNFTIRENVTSSSSTSTSESEHNGEVSSIEQDVGDSLVELNNSLFSPEFVGEIGTEEVMEYDGGDEEQVNSSINPNALRVRRISANTTDDIDTVNDIDLVPIGSGVAKVPRRILDDIDWNSHTSATRQLLKALFPRRVLATHCLTGKRSPAFLNRPPKKMLNPQIVDDIVKTVSTRCGVTKRFVRRIITIKCTDEAKLYRNRQQFKPTFKPLHENEENVPPSTSSSDESDAVMNLI